MSEHREPSARFIVDRMLGTLCRYLRLMGYDTASANAYAEGNRREDTLLLLRAREEQRLLLTRDRELARRGGDQAVLITGEDVMAQLRQLVSAGVIVPAIRLNRCSICNEYLRPASADEVSSASYAPRKREHLDFYWCRRCRKLYWLGSHGKNLEKRLKDGLSGE
ncbi:uncharacterized protein with PIN domain [Methanolinea mesophila]|uniref:Mut7-C RNAse domain-containing protein n=1 Tax=Methanolinea mesophila TaxID=547055 RepID=UPI001AE2BD19|nr:Mut7-C RNAse domain-containing protein [Methanolinea mesophila]MBP1928116.1 uncharacterized protein with PIN domain [Methanolinea mesophila]